MQVRTGVHTWTQTTCTYTTDADTHLPMLLGKLPLSMSEGAQFGVNGLIILNNKHQHQQINTADPHNFQITQFRQTLIIKHNFYTTNRVLSPTLLLFNVSTIITTL